MIVADPWFYALAVPAVLMTGLSKSGAIGGFGALAVPMMALALPVPQAAAILLPLLCIMDFTGLAAMYQQRDRVLTRLLIPAGLCGTVVGTLMFGLLKASAVAGIVGAVTLLFLALRTLWPPKADAPPPPRAVGLLLGLTSGFTSFVSHAGSPPLAFYMMPMRLPPATFAATSAVFFTAINLSKWLPYAWLGLIDTTNMATSALLAPLAPVGVWVGVRWVRGMPAALFYKLLNVGMLLTGLKLLWDGLRG